MVSQYLMSYNKHIFYSVCLPSGSKTMLTKSLVSNSFKTKRKRGWETEGIYKCEYCFASFKVSADFDQHVESHFCDTLQGGKNSHPCLVCRTKFSSKDDLSAHMKMHEGGTTFDCEVSI